eukprot:TRINITY_DN13551_c0_g1_i2.p1 TRINITY_DN13551_c0_g1~~TRINITY_DN13551_c0_g1_i2.p1  ORF type:complete len:151 (-),score=43.78 TRINITY_DN13551_c0_g1_i2:115-567(-)
MVDNLTQEQIEMYKQAFSEFDKEGNGWIATKELGVVMRQLGQYPTEAELEDLIAEVDQDGNGRIEFEEFLSLFAKRMKESDTNQKCLEAFRVFDKQNKGTISKFDLENILLNMGEKSSQSELIELMRELPFNQNNELEYEAFVQKIFSSL